MASLITGNKIPLYKQVATTLKQRVRVGEYQTGKTLPSVRTLCKEFGVGTNAIQKAIYDLEAEGIVATHHGKGMIVLQDDPCKTVAIFLGFIHPYSEEMAFGQSVLHYADKAFRKRHNFLVARSSLGQSQIEQEVAENFANNGIKGLIVWPVENSSNAIYFQELARRIPVVVIDRRLEGAVSLPTMLFDSYECGRLVCRHFLETLKCKRVLALIDDLDISPYREQVKGLHDQAVQMKRMNDLTVVKLPISSLVKQINGSDFSQIDRFKVYVERLLQDGYDAIFCQQEEFIDYIIMETGLFDVFPHLRLGCMGNPQANICSRKFGESGVFRWNVDHPKMIGLAADLLQQWVLTRRRPEKLVKLSIDLCQ